MHNFEKRSGIMELEINIMGSNYKVLFSNDRKDLHLSDGYQGETNFNEKTIEILTYFEGRTELKDIKKGVEQVLIHELTHAYFYESGMVTLGTEEQIPEYFSVCFKKMLKSFIFCNRCLFDVFDIDAFVC